MNFKKFFPEYYILCSTTIYCRSLPLITALLFQEEIEYTRALDDQDGSSFWRPSLLQFNNITFYLQVHYTLYAVQYTHTLDILSGNRHYFSLIILHSTFRFIIHYTLYTHTLDILSGDRHYYSLTILHSICRVINHYALYTIHSYTKYSFWRLSVLQFNNITIYLQGHYGNN